MASLTFVLGDGRTIPGIGLGTFQIAASDAEAAVAAAFKVGYKHVDTADSYQNEKEIGKALVKNDRGSIFVTTKLFPGNPQWGMPAKTYDETVAACKQSLANLGVDSIDLYMIHAPMAGSAEARVAQWKALVECQAQGLCKSIGVSNYGVAHLKEIAAAGLPMPAANQLELHPLTQKPELLAYMKAHKILPIAYASLAPLSNWREGYQTIKGTKTDDEKKDTTVEVIAKRLGVSPARLLLRYALQRGWACIPKTTKENRLKENLDIDAFELSEEDVKALDALEANANLTWDAPPGQHFDLTTLP
jgi:2,5-diketo-D-gluconate reductase A